MDTKTQLRYEYRRTWEAFSRHTNTVHKLAGSADPATLETEMRKADLALAAHRAARNRLAATLAAGTGAADSRRSARRSAT